MPAAPSEAPPSRYIAILDNKEDGDRLVDIIAFRLVSTSAVDHVLHPRDIVRKAATNPYDLLILDPAALPEDPAAFLQKLRNGEIADRIVLCSRLTAFRHLRMHTDMGAWLENLPIINKELDDERIADLLTTIVTSADDAINPAAVLRPRDTGRPSPPAGKSDRLGALVLTSIPSGGRLASVLQSLESTFTLGEVRHAADPPYEEVRTAWPRIIVLDETAGFPKALPDIVHFASINGVELLRFGRSSSLNDSIIPPSDWPWFNARPSLEPSLPDEQLSRELAAFVAQVPGISPRPAVQAQSIFPSPAPEAPAAAPRTRSRKSSANAAPETKAASPPAKRAKGTGSGEMRMRGGGSVTQQMTADLLAQRPSIEVDADAVVEHVENIAEPNAAAGVGTGAGGPPEEQRQTKGGAPQVKEVAEELGVSAEELLDILGGMGSGVASASATFPEEFRDSVTERIWLRATLVSLSEGGPLEEPERLDRALPLSDSARKALGMALGYGGLDLDSTLLLAGVAVAGDNDDRDTSAVFRACLRTGADEAHRGTVANQLGLAWTDDDPGTAEPFDFARAGDATRDFWAAVRKGFRIVELVGRARAPEERNVSARHLLAAVLVTEPPLAGKARLRELGYDVADLCEKLLDRLYEVGVRDDLAEWARLLAPEGAAAPQFLDEPQAIAHEPDAPNGRSDQLDITREVNAMCALLAAESTRPPLSVGLFGDWGAGKSFFMSKMQKRIRWLARTGRQNAAAGRPPVYCRRIAQITFNAWHYMDANLWASLVTRVFEGLAEHLAPRADEVERLREELVGKLAANQAEITRVETEITRVAAEETALARKLASLAGEETAIETELDTLPAQVRALWDAARAEPEVEGWLAEAEGELRGIRLRVDETGLPQQIAELRGFGASVREGVRVARASSPTLWAAAAVLIVLGVAAGLAWYVWRAEGGRVTQAVVGLLVSFSASLGGLVGALRRLKAPIDRGRTLLERANARLNERRQAMKDELATREAARRAELEAKRREAAELRRREADVKAEIARLTADIAEIRAGRRMERFIVERSGSDEYRRHLGIVALIRKDFEKLGELLDQVRADPTDTKIERIVLYIDDLDRCPEDRVVEVLQAVHLLLAFPLFVVVVGVDSRWLLRSLKQHYAMEDAERRDDRDGRRGDGEEDDQEMWESTPHSYLEKIFQIPFTLRPMDHDGFGRLVGCLLDGKAEDAPDEEDPDTDLRPPADAGMIPARPVSAAEPIEVAPEEEDPDEETDTPTPAADAGPDESGPVDVAPVRTVAPAGRGEAIAAEREEVADVTVSLEEARGDGAGEVVPVDDEDEMDAAEEDGSDDVGDSRGAEEAAERDAAHAAADAGGEAAAAAMEIPDEEVEFIKRLSPLIRSPRAANRFVNVYRFIRAGMKPGELRRFRGGGGRPGEFRAAALLLALVTGFPWQAGELLEEIARAEHQTGKRWRDVRDSVARRAGGDVRPRDTGGEADEDAAAGGAEDAEALPRRDVRRWRELQTALAEVERHMADAPMPEDLAAYARWAEHVGRFSFHTGHVITRRRA